MKKIILFSLLCVLFSCSSNNSVDNHELKTVTSKNSISKTEPNTVSDKPNPFIGRWFCDGIQIYMTINETNEVSLGHSVCQMTLMSELIGDELVLKYNEDYPLECKVPSGFDLKTGTIVGICRISNNTITIETKTHNKDWKHLLPNEGVMTFIKIE